ncbi:hypothetical protein GF415_04070 [Candidatus Micrarchaeota archaeon]|nr:hypothetical protein [Candidatus Micrarchaeota archaeon]
MAQAQKAQKTNAEEQRIGWTVWRATYSGKGAKPELSRWAKGLVPYSEKSDLEDFLRNPEGKEFVMFFDNEEDAKDLAKLINNSGLTKQVIAEIQGISGDDRIEYTVPAGAKIKLTLTVQKKKRIGKLPPRQKELYDMVKAEEWREREEADGLTDMANRGLGNVGPLGKQEGGLFDSVVPRRATPGGEEEEAKKKEVTWKRFIMRPKDYEGDKVSLFPQNLSKKRKEELLKSLNRIIKAINHGESYGIKNDVGGMVPIIENGRSIKPFTIEVHPMLAKHMFGGTGPKAKKWLASRGLKPEWVKVNRNLVTIDTRKSKKGETPAEKAAREEYEETLAFLRGGRTF